MLAMAVKFDSRTDCVYATFEGRVEPEALLQDLCRVVDVAAERSQRLVLLDQSAFEGNLATNDRFKIGEGGASYAFSKARALGLKVALVGKPPLIDVFAAMVAANRGVKIKVFSEIPQALDWLGLTN